MGWFFPGYGETVGDALRSFWGMNERTIIKLNNARMEHENAKL
jgi:hypothetical protein